MTFTLDASPEPSHSPPRVLLTATEDDPAKPLQSCSFFRDGVALRFSATVGGGTALAYDYDAPFDASLTYRADAVEAATLVLDWTEAWASLAAWTSVGAGWSVAASKATTSTSNSSIKRASTGTIAKVHGVDPAITGSDTNFGISLLDATGLSVATLVFAPVAVALVTQLGSDSVALVAPTTFDITVGSASVTASGSGWSLTVPYSGVATQVFLAMETLAGGATASIDDVSVYKYAVPPTADVTASDTTSLTGVTGAWLTNAAQPELAVVVNDCSQAAPDLYLTDQTRAQTVARSSSVALDIEGSPDVLTVVPGPRKRETWTMEVACRTEAARQDLDDLLANNAAISFRQPATMSALGLADGFYAVGDVTTNRPNGPVVNQMTTVELPLTPSRAPSFDALWSWNWGSLAQTGMTWAQAQAAFPTWLDLLIGPTT